MTAQSFDVIVAGVGGMGAQTCLRLAERGHRVLGLERFDIPHNMGSSHGINRIIRLAYFEHPGYVPLLRRAYELWRDLERRAGEQLLFITGSMDIGPAGSPIVENSRASCRLHDLPHEVLSATEVNRRYPGYSLPADYEAVLQPDGGFVASERAIVAAVNLAMQSGAVIRAREPLIDYTPLPGGGVRVRTQHAHYEAGRLVLTSGGWIGDHVPQLAATAIPERQVLGWFQPKTPAHFCLGAFPVSNVKCDLGHFYQFPVWHVPGFKIGLYHHLRETGSADTISRDPTPADEQILRQGLARFFPNANGDCLALRACLFTNTPDEHFIIDTLPGFPEVVVASPCSGHGYKFASVIGEILTDLATGRSPPFDLSLFSIARLPSQA
jgi:sarcosine oxidase